MSGRSTGTAALLLLAAATTAPVARAQGSDVTPFTLTLLSSNAGGIVPPAQVHSGHGCKGGNTPPALQWSAPPAGTKSFAVSMFDMTANKGAGFWHWVMFDIAPDLRKLDLNQRPDGTETGRNDYGDIAYGGACPPKTERHQYQISVWGLPEAKLPFGNGAPDAEIGAFLKSHALGKADLTLSYQR